MKKTDGQAAAQEDIQSAILHDAYFNKPPSFIVLFAVRLALLCGLSVSMIWSITDLYLFTDDQLLICGVSAAAAVILFTLASLLPSGAVYFTVFFGGAAIGWFAREELISRLGYFWDGLMLRLESRLLATKPFFIHNYERVKAGRYDDEIQGGLLFGLILLAILLAFIVVSSSRTRFHPFPVLLMFALLAAPAFAAEICGFHFSIVAFIAIFAALHTVNIGHELDERLVFGKARAAREALHTSEQSYRRRTRFFTFKRKLYNDLPRYYKYSANSLLALIISAGLLLGGNAVIPNGQGFDFRSIFNAVQEVGVSVADSVGGALGVTFGSVNDNGYFSYSNYGDDSGGIGISEPARGNIPVMDVILDRNDISVYLRGDIGVRFAGSSWTSVRDEYSGFYDAEGKRYEDIFEDFYPDIQYQVLRQRLSSLGYNPDRLFPLQNVSISYRRSTKVVFQPLAPYELTFKNSGDYDCFGDQILRTKNGRGYIKRFDSLSLTPFMDNYYMSEAVTSAKTSRELDWTLPDGMSSSEYGGFIGKYNELVRKMYMEYDGELIRQLLDDMHSGGYISDRFLSEQGAYISGMSDYDAAEGVCRYFRENFRYSLDTDNGRGSELLKNFLYKTKEGHCALFASAMVHAMRAMGIPARYITGYVAYGEGEALADGRYRYTLRENDLHAWVEVYFDKVGWLPFDPTAAVSGFGFGSAEAPPFMQETTSLQDTEPLPERTTPEITVTTAPDETAPEDSEASTLVPPDEYDPDITGPAGGQRPPGTYEPGKESFADIFARILPYLVIGVIALAVITVLALFVRGVRNAENKAINGFRKKPADRAVSEMYRLVITLLSGEGISPGAETLTDYAVRADASPLIKGANVFLTDVMPIFSKCEFGDPEISPVTEEERLAAVKFTMALYRRVMDKKNPIAKFFTKISLFL